MDLESEQLFSCISSGDFDKFSTLLAKNANCVSIRNKDGLCPLHIAAHYGKPQFLSALIAKGANVESSNNSDGYTPLMFAALSGNLDCVNVLLENGADATRVNRIGKTASMLAQFVGNERIGRTICHWFPSADLSRFTGSIPPSALPPLGQLLGISNFNPIWVALRVTSLLCGTLHEAVEDVMLGMCRHYAEEGEVWTLKCFYIQLVIHRVRTKSLQKWAKWFGGGRPRLLTHEDIVGGRLRWSNVDGFVRDIPRVYCFPRTMGLVALQHHLKSSEKCPVECLSLSLGGQLPDRRAQCVVCDERDISLKLCQCRSVLYCGEVCQKVHWFRHKARCRQSRDFNQ